MPLRFGNSKGLTAKNSLDEKGDPKHFLGRLKDRTITKQISEVTNLTL